MAREDWFPERRPLLRKLSFYTMSFRTPKSLEVVATGNEVSDMRSRGSGSVCGKAWFPLRWPASTWVTFKKQTSERNKNLQIVSYADRDLANPYAGLSDIRHGAGIDDDHGNAEAGDVGRRCRGANLYANTSARLPTTMFT